MFKHARRDSAVFEQMRRENQGEYAAYTPDQHLMSILVDAVQDATYATRCLDFHFVTAHGSKNARPPKPPTPLERPGFVGKSRAKDEIQRTPAGIMGKHVGTDPIPMRDFDRFWADPESYLREQNPEAN